MSERDIDTLRRIGEHRYLRSEHVQDFLFTGFASQEAAARTTRRVLKRLYGEGLLRPLERRIGGLRAGSAGTVWQLTPAGARLLHDEDGYRTHEPSPRFLSHCLAVAETHLRLRTLADSGEIESIEVTVEPATWRTFPGRGGENRLLKPDLAAVLRTALYEDRWFAEIDCGTESIPTLLRKCEQYELYRATGIEQERHDIFPLVLWIMEGRRAEERTERLRQALARSSRFTPGLYRYATIETAADVVGGDA